MKHLELSSPLLLPIIFLVHSNFQNLQYLGPFAKNVISPLNCNKKFTIENFPESGRNLFLPPSTHHNHNEHQKFSFDNLTHSQQFENMNLINTPKIAHMDNLHTIKEEVKEESEKCEDEDLQNFTQNNFNLPHLKDFKKEKNNPMLIQRTIDEKLNNKAEMELESELVENEEGIYDEQRVNEKNLSIFKKGAAFSSSVDLKKKLSLNIELINDDHKQMNQLLQQSSVHSQSSNIEDNFSKKSIAKPRRISENSEEKENSNSNSNANSNLGAKEEDKSKQNTTRKEKKANCNLNSNSNSSESSNKTIGSSFKLIRPKPYSGYETVGLQPKHSPLNSLLSTPKTPYSLSNYLSSYPQQTCPSKTQSANFSNSKPITIISSNSQIIKNQIFTPQHHLHYTLLNTQPRRNSISNNEFLNTPANPSSSLNQNTHNFNNQNQ